MSRGKKQGTLPDPAGSRFRIEFARHKRARVHRVLHFVGTMIDPRAWSHLFKMVNYYN